jgi:nucleotide-binding universal stress UspA family protein
VAPDDEMEADVDYSTLMVHLDLEQPNDARLQVAGELAERFDAAVIGIAACAYSPPPYYVDTAFVQGLISQERSRVTTLINELEARFRSSMQNRTKKLEWRSSFMPPTEYVAGESRAADLVITGPADNSIILDPFRTLDVSSLVMQAGRPILIVPPGTDRLNRKALVAWKDTREARRAVWDALPLLRKAEEVTVIEVLEDEATEKQAGDRVRDVADWLQRHDVNASGRTSPGMEDTADQLDRIAAGAGADIVVAGAYGHNRLREWVFGGVTDSLLNDSKRCVLLTH